MSSKIAKMKFASKWKDRYASNLWCIRWKCNKN